MISLFHVSAFICSAIGLVFGALVGRAHFGWWGVLLGIPLGAYVGLVLGRLPRFVGALILRRRANTGVPDKKREL
jgi:hypothetical protein